MVRYSVARAFVATGEIRLAAPSAQVIAGREGNY
jgi:hypothetical protein